MRVSAGSAVKYATLPGIIPRLRELFFTGFGPVTYLVALICAMVGLLPRTHPCFSKETRHQYGLRHVLAAAANGLEFKWKNIDQILIFGTILCGTAMMLLYIIGAVLFVLVSPASALGMLIPDLLVTAEPSKDIAFMMLDRVFGLPDVFNSCVSTGAPCYNTSVTANVAPPLPFPTPFQIAMQQLFMFYSMGIFFLALVIFLYHIVHIVFEVTQTGKVADHMSDDVMAPYESSPSHGFTWLPIRFLVCFGLLLPFGEGLNSAQWIVLYTAKYGSGLATNAWIQYNVSIGENPTGEVNTSLVSRPNELDTSQLIKSLLLLRACRDIHGEIYAQEEDGQRVAYNVQPYAINGKDSMPVYGAGGNAGYRGGQAGAIANGGAGDPFIDLLNFSGIRDIRIVLGYIDPEKPLLYEKYPGKVLPVCGEIVIPVTGRTGEALFAAEGYLYAVMHLIDWRPVLRGGGAPPPFQANAYVAVTREFNRISSDIKIRIRPPYIKRPCYWDFDGDFYESAMGDGGQYLGYCKNAVPSTYWNTLMNDYYRQAFAVPPLSAYDFLAGTALAPAYDARYAIGGTAWSALGKTNPFLMTAGILEYGWGGAGLWYNKISERNGSLYTATTSIPVVQKYPMIMEDIRNIRQKTDTSSGASFCENYNPRKSGMTASYNPTEKNQFSAEQASALYALCSQLYDNQNVQMTNVTRQAPANNPIEAAIASFFAEFKSYDIMKNYDVTPMAQLSSMGRMMVDKAILGIVGSGVAAAAGGAFHMMAASSPNPQMEAMGMFSGAMSSLIMTIAIIGLTGGVMLHYVLPFMPFVYFFFAVGRWVKVIFEALVGVPLWALAHMRIGGPGLPGDAASSGYFLILEIFIRPVLTVFSLVGAFAIFSALAVGLNSIFTLVSANLFGSLPTGMTLQGAIADGNVMELGRGMIDQFFLTIFYILIMYVIGTGSFKLIDLIPDNIMRWSGAGVSSMGAADISDDLLDNFERELPYRFEHVAQEAGDVLRKTLYQPGKDANDKANEALQKAAKEEYEADKAQKEAQKERKEANEAAKKAQADPMNSELQKRAREEEIEARQAESQFKKGRAEADKAAKDGEQYGVTQADIDKKEAKITEAQAKQAGVAKTGGSLFSKLSGFFGGDK